MLEEILKYVEKTPTCWFWLRGHNKHRRPYYKNKLVYRILYEELRGEIPEGLGLDHVVCDTPWCVNPWHVEPKTQKENLARVALVNNFGLYAKKGNVLSGENLGQFLGMKGRERNTLGQFTGG